MEDLLSTVKTVRVRSDQRPENDITAISTSITRHDDEAIVHSTETGRNAGIVPSRAATTISLASANDALQVLRSQPSFESLVTTLRWLTARDGNNGGFSVSSPSPIQVSIVNVLLDEIIPNFWPTLSEGDQELLLLCLRNLTGINAALARMRLLSSDSGTASGADHERHHLLFDVTEGLLRGHDCIWGLWSRLNEAISDRVRRDLAWKELTVLLGSGKVVGVVAQAEDAIKRSSSKAIASASWLSKGSDYATWLGLNIASSVRQISDSSANETGQQASQDFSRLLQKALSLGQPIPVVDGLIRGIMSEENNGEGLQQITSRLPPHTQKLYLEYLLRWMTTVSSDSRAPGLEDESSTITKDLDACLAAVSMFTRGESLQNHVAALLCDPAITAMLSIPSSRACIESLDHSAPETLDTVLEKNMTTFGDRIFIDHAPIQQQESVARIILQTAGTIHRRDPMTVLLIARSGPHIQGTSNRLDASSDRARWLGMIVAMAISSLVDKEGSRMDFGVDDIRTEEAKRWLSLVSLQPVKLGNPADLAAFLKEKDSQKKRTRARYPTQKQAEQAPQMLNGKLVFGPPRPPPPPAQTEVVGEKVTELLDVGSDEEEEEEDLKPYAKPDSDPEDSDEDATLVNRNKARPPVYIRDLMSMLRDDKNHDRFELGIKHAAALIRRKTGFGAEVKDHAEELISVLCNLQDPFGTEEFDELRLQAMIAVLLSDVAIIGPWLSRHAFAEGFSTAQRCTMMTALGLGGRELAGLKNEDDIFNPATPASDFPTKRLPPHLHSIYTPAPPPTKRLQSATTSLEDELMQPLALRVAEKSTAQLSALKTRTLSSRLTSTNRTRTKPTPNALAKIFPETFFNPLLTRYTQDITFYSSSSLFSSSSVLLTTFLKTLALLLHASGPATKDLPDVTSQFWDLLLSLRVKAVGDIGVLQAVLFSLLTLLEVNSAAVGGMRRVGREEGRRLEETQRWVEIVFERAGGTRMAGLASGGKGEGDEAKVRTLAAGVLVRLQEVVEEVQREVFGKALGE